MQPDHAPTPFSAAQIHAACPVGRHNLYELRTEGKAPLYQLSTFVASNERGAEFQAELVNEEGAEVGGVQRASATWEELQAHASFPEANTEIRRERIKVPAGTFDCWRYTVTETDDEWTLVHRLWFTPELPGPPVRMEQATNGELVFHMILLKTGTDAGELR